MGAGRRVANLPVGVAHTCAAPLKTAQWDFPNTSPQDPLKCQVQNSQNSLDCEKAFCATDCEKAFCVCYVLHALETALMCNPGPNRSWRSEFKSDGGSPHKHHHTAWHAVRSTLTRLHRRKQIQSIFSPSASVQNRERLLLPAAPIEKVCLASSNYP